MAYIPTHTPASVAGLPADIIGTGGVALKSFTPLIVGVGVGFGLYKMAKKRAKMVKKVKKMSNRNPRKIKGGFAIW